jgi:hypothetical protein
MNAMLQANKERFMKQTILIQRLEGLAILIVSTMLYARLDAGWWFFALLLLAPDVSMAGYLVDKAIGQTVYNVAHTYTLPLLLAVAGFWFGSDLALTLSLIWLAHIGMDRVLGYGLKEAAGFKFTHLNPHVNLQQV